MDNDKLKVSFVESKPSLPPLRPEKVNRRLETQGVMERLWHNDPNKFNPNRDCMERHRIELTFDAICCKGPLQNKRVADLGCGTGILAIKLANEGAHVDAVDVATNALEIVKKNHHPLICTVHDCLPNTKLNDNHYDFVVCTDLIAYLNPSEQRILMAELARLVKTEGTVIISTALDIDTDDPLERFASLGETEFIIETWALSYHRLLIKLLRFFDTPAFYDSAHSDKEKFRHELDKRHGFLKWWFMLNTSAIPALGWKAISFLTNPIANILRQNTKLMHFLDKISRLLWNEDAVSNAIFVGKRRPLTFPLPSNEIPKEMKHKRQLWE